MGKNYYCDFCDKTFADKANNRKNHLKGLIHQQCRKAFYDQFRKPEVILAEEMAKRPCKHFLSSGNCSFMASCKYSHMTDEQKQEMQRQIDLKKSVVASKTKETEEPPSLDKWLGKVQKCSKDKIKGEITPTRLDLPMYSLPPHLGGIANLPPSLLPPPPDVFTSLPLEEWG
ncbi:zinc finger matrin-type protein 5-like [Pecten maximus]|uniref:zinc finger matrin-type protein 5-like n=1 Tax=Pecten maximus TaxID=6579 RepID=UPI001458F629|nr:zinc finger matrin-type protein 5-like [Pecten maximus]XP_033743701.1 zinc finger matrin-type protein 5-like [Pecten maximus]XP_033743703.1 zinc finger matrin-type protein 5-like [Pecten maximus]XP_033743704.1 zinc finger matrin-type protein 5-like [Pecten maximus]